MDIINQAAIEMNSTAYWIEQAEALAELEKNPHYKKVIEQGYFTDRAINGTSLLANDQIKRSNSRTDVMESLIAISTLKDHFNTIKNLGQSAKDDLESERLGEE